MITVFLTCCVKKYRLFFFKYIICFRSLITAFPFIYFVIFVITKDFPLTYVVTSENAQPRKANKFCILFGWNVIYYPNSSQFL